MDSSEEAQPKLKYITLIMASAIVVSALVAGGGVYAYQKSQADTTQKDLQAQIDSLKSHVAESKSVMATATPVPSAMASATVTTSTKAVYSNTKYGYSFEYPSNSLQLTAGAGNTGDLVITPTAEGVNVSKKGDSVGNGVFYVSIPGIQLTPASIRGQFGATKAENLSVTATTIGGVSGYKAVISGDSSVVSNFYFIKNVAGTVLELTAVISSSDAQGVLGSFKLAK